MCYLFVYFWIGWKEQLHNIWYAKMPWTMLKCLWVQFWDYCRHHVTISVGHWQYTITSNSSNSRTGVKREKNEERFCKPYFSLLNRNHNEISNNLFHFANDSPDCCWKVGGFLISVEGVFANVSGVQNYCFGISIIDLNKKISMGPKKQQKKL